MTTNGVLLAGQAAALRAAGLHRVTVSLDTLRPERFRALTRRDDHAARPARDRGRPGGRVPGPQARHRGHPGGQRGRADRPRRVRPAASTPRCASSSTWTSAARPTGRASRWSRARRCSSALAAAVRADRADSRGVVRARRAIPAAGRHDVRHHRLDHDALLPDLRPEPAHGRRHLVPVPLRAARRRPPDAAPGRRVARRAPRPHRRAAGRRRRDRGAEERKELEAIGHRGVLVQIEGLRQDPHLEMHTRGG